MSGASWRGAMGGSRTTSRTSYATYGPGKREAEAKLKEIERRRAAGGFLYRATGRAEHDRDEPEALRPTLADIERRGEEQRAG